MAHNHASHSNHISEEEKNKLTLILQKIRNLKETHDNGYACLLDTSHKKTPDIDETIRLVAPIKKSLTEHILLVHKARDIMREYLKMKSFILDTYVMTVAHNAGLRDSASQQKMRHDIDIEMQENLKNVANLSTRLANETGSPLDKDLAHSELKLLVHDLSYRINSYRRYYQSHLADINHESECIYDNSKTVVN
jgi:hypothetical protein